MADPVVNKSFAFNLPSPYQAELSSIADQLRMAQMLQAQSQQPTERFTYKGIEAHTPATAGLAKILQSLSGAYFQKEARDQEKALGEKYRQEEMDDITRYAEMAGKPAVAAVPGQRSIYAYGSRLRRSR
jgi:cell pole-organizing protein PopZ